MGTVLAMTESQPAEDPWRHVPIESAEGEHCFCGQPASHKVEEVTDQARHPFTRYVCCKHFAALMGKVASRWCFP